MWSTARTSAHQHSSGLARLVVLAASLLLPVQLWAHPIDEVQSEAMVQLETADQQHFATRLVFASSHLEEYQRMLADMGLPPERDREEMARSVARAFAFGPCTLQPAKADKRFTDLGNGAWLGIGFDLTCPQPMRELTLTRNDFSRDKTRTTLLWTVALPGGRKAEALLPPHLETATLSLEHGGLMAAERGNRKGVLQDSAKGGHQPTDEFPAGDFPLPGDQKTWQRPANQLLLAWAQEGALHLAFGPDHLLFLLTLVLAGQRLGRTALAVSGFSLGHVTSMALALVNDWPPVPFLDVVIGGTIAFSAWSARKSEPLPLGRMVGMAVAFGLVHGLGFGSGLQALTGGVDSIVWPLLTFGLGLDAAQLLWVALAWLVWRQVQRRTAVFAVAQQRASWALVASGVAASVLALVTGLRGE
jgi:hypothetical protein